MSVKVLSHPNCSGILWDHLGFYSTPNSVVGQPHKSFCRVSGVPRRLQRDEGGRSSTHIWSRPEAFQHLETERSLWLCCHFLAHFGPSPPLPPPVQPGKVLISASVQFLLPCSPSPICCLPCSGRGCRLSSHRTLAAHLLSLGRAATSPAASPSQTWQGREEKLEWGRGPQAFHSSNRINLIYRHSKMQLKQELK